MALKWSITEKFSHWLKGHDFTVWTDNNPLTHILTKPKLDAYEQRWVAKLSSYTFDLKYIPGPKNIVADALSRAPFTSSISSRLIQEPYNKLVREAEGAEPDEVHDAFRSGIQHSQFIERHESPPDKPGLCSSPQIKAVLLNHKDWESHVEARTSQLVHHVQLWRQSGQDTLPSLTPHELENQQLQDLTIASVMPFVVRKRRPSRRERHGLGVKSLVLLKHWEKLKVRDGIMYRETRDPVSKTKRLQLVLPAGLRNRALEGVHDLAGHQGQARTLHLARQRFFWPSMEKDVKDYVRCCERCVLAKTPEPSARAPLESIKTSAPMELVCIDFWTAEDRNKNSVDVLVATDHFTKMAHAFPCRNQTAKQIAKQLWDRMFCVYGFPERIHSDQGPNFESELVSELLQLSGVDKSHTTAYHPMGNGCTERFNRTLGNMLRALPLGAKNSWPQQIHTLTFAYNATVHETTGYAPFFLMFGRVPRLPVDIVFNSVLHDPLVVDFSSYSKTLLSYLSEAAQIAQRQAIKQQEHQARQYNKKVRGVSLHVGDRVLLANKGERGKKKLADKWEPKVYTVVESNPELHIYKISDVSGQCKVVHRNLLLDVSFLPVRDTLECQSLDTSSEVSGLGDDVEADGVSSLGMESPRTRTSWWVHSGEDRDTQGGAERDELALQLPDNHDTLGDGVADMDDTHVGPDSPVPLTETCSDPTGDLADSEQTPPIPTADLDLTNCDSDRGVVPGQVVTRTGRVVKPVNRLIESMVQGMLSVA